MIVVFLLMDLYLLLAMVLRDLQVLKVLKVLKDLQEGVAVAVENSL